MSRLGGKVAVVTGGGAGIGRAACRIFAKEGASIIVADIDEESGRKTVDDIAREGGTASFVLTDVTDPESVEACVARATSTYGRLDVLMNNAGGSTGDDRPVADCSAEQFWKSVRLNLFSVWLGCHYGVPAIVKSGGGSIINMASAMAVEPTVGRDAYTAAKGGVVSLTRSMAVEYGAANVRVNALAPGATMSERITAQFGNLPKEHVDTLMRQHPLGLGKPENVAYFALFLASDESRYTSGQVFQVNNELHGL